MHKALHHIHHHGQKHLYAFHVKHNVSPLTLGLLILLAIEMNFVAYLGLLPAQNPNIDIPMSFAGSLLQFLGNF